MIHKIKGLYDQGRGLSVRAISRELRISRNTVRKYLHLDEVQISGFHAIRTLSPRTSGHLFHDHSDRQSERSDAGVALLV